ncbi:MAG TPA: HAMP domain-containing sensor histidine kinase [Stellaceae bacterium]|nr:HAMP domain-containing sensor histidine kinase [Stellaceae bacterium]
MFRKMIKIETEMVETRELFMRLSATPGHTDPTQTRSLLISSSITLAIWIVAAASVDEKPAIQQLMIVLLAALATALLYALFRESDRRAQREIELADKQAKLKAANIDLEESKKRAEKANTAKSLFLANMSHELRTPLNAIIGFSEIIKKPARGPDGIKRYAEYAEDIFNAGQHLSALIGNILDISKIEAGRMGLDDEVFEIAELAEASISLLGQRVKQKSITLETDLRKYALRIRADGLKLRQALVNLLSNAVKFTPDGGRVTLRLEQASDGEFVISVSDSGIGMSPDEITTALEPFGQVDDGLAKHYQGTGIGLPLARRLVELHGGRLEIESIKNSGTTVRIRLPANRVVGRAEVAPVIAAASLCVPA